MSQSSTNASDAPLPPAAPAPGSHFADPAPLGLAAFALTTFVLSLANSGIMSVTAESAVFSLALFYGGLAQFAAGLWEFARGNTFGSTAFCSFGAFWMSFWYLTGHTTPAPSAKGVGAFLLAWAIFAAYMTIVALRLNVAILAIFALLTVALLFLAFGAIHDSTGLTKIGGYLGILTALVAWYTSFAGVANTTWGKEVFPTFPLS